MRGLWLHLLRGGGRSARLEIGLPLAAGCLITFVLLLLLGLQQGLDHRADRTAWRTPEPAAAEATVLQAGRIDYVGERPITVIELAALTSDPPDLPGTGDFPEPGELWTSPELARLLADLPDDRLADRYGEPDAELGPDLLESPDELLAVVGRDPDDPAMTAERPPHQSGRRPAPMVERPVHRRGDRAVLGPQLQPVRVGRLHRRADPRLGAPGRRPLDPLRPGPDARARSADDPGAPGRPAPRR